MEPLFTTTVKDLRDNTVLRIAECRKYIADMRRITYQKIMDCDSYAQIKAIMSQHNEHGIDTKLNQYEENLKYLNACDIDKQVTLNQSEWRHYFHAEQRPEWC